MSLIDDYLRTMESRLAGLDLNKGAASLSAPPQLDVKCPKNVDAVPKNPGLYKTQLCKSFLQNQECQFGRYCWFAHGNHELRQKHIAKLEMFSPLSCVGHQCSCPFCMYHQQLLKIKNIPKLSQVKANAMPKKPEKYKTEICRNFYSITGCKFGENCWYAHGGEMR